MGSHAEIRAGSRVGYSVLTVRAWVFLRWVRWRAGGTRGNAAFPLHALDRVSPHWLYQHHRSSRSKCHNAISEKTLTIKPRTVTPFRFGANDIVT